MPPTRRIVTLVLLTTIGCGGSDRAGEQLDDSSEAACTGTTPPTTFTAPLVKSPTDVAKLPPLPSVGPANSQFRDPTFGSRMFRVTDPKTTSAGPSLVTPASAESNIFNSTSTRFFVRVRGSGASVAFRFDPSTLQARVDTSVGAHSDGTLPLSNPEFSRSQPNIVYGTSGHRIVAYDFWARTTTTLLDLDKQCPGLTLAETDTMADLAASSDNDCDGKDDRLSVTTGGPGQDRWHVAVVWDRAKGCRYYDPYTDTMGGAWGPRCTGCTGAVSGGVGLHNTKISRDAKYLIAEPQMSGSGPIIWAVDGTVTRYWSDPNGHHAWGFGGFMHPDWAKPGDGAEGRWLFRPANDPNTPEFVADRYCSHDNHSSWNNARPNASVPLIVDSYVDDGIVAPTDGEVFAVATDGSGKTWRFAHNRTDINQGGAGYNFWATPRGNVSQNGRYFLFTSNWGCTLPKDASGVCRTDVFGVVLE